MNRLGFSFDFSVCFPGDTGVGRREVYEQSGMGISTARRHFSSM